MTQTALADFLVSCADVLLLEASDVTATSVGLDGDTPLHVALWQGNMDVVSLLIEAGADVDAKGDLSQTPLHVALSQRNLEGVKTLLSAGAKTELVSEFGHSQRQLAEEIGGDFHTAFLQSNG